MRKPSKCPTCKEHSCGNDDHVTTKYLGPERNVGDRMKVILTQLYDMVERDNLQHHEILGLVKATLVEHIPEIDLNEQS